MPKVTIKLKEFVVCLKHKEKINDYYSCIILRQSTELVMQYLWTTYQEYNIISVNFTGYAD